MMNTRDFCFWLQGYCELTGGAYPTAAQIKMIQEHLELTKEPDRSGYYCFDHFCDNLNGFFSINGSDITGAQWDNVVKQLQDVFTKVTSELEEDEENGKKSNEEKWDEIFKDIMRRKEGETTPYIPPFIPPQPSPWEPQNPWTQPHDPWKLPDVICSPDTSTGDPNKFNPTVTCSSSDDISLSEKACNQSNLMDSIKAAEDTINKINEHSNRPSDTAFCASLEAAYDRVQHDDEVLDLMGR